MSNQQKSKSNSSSFISIIISISLVLFLLGIMGFVIIHAGKLSNYVKENIPVSLILKNSGREVDIIRLKKNLDASEFVKRTEYIDQEKASKMLKNDLGEDFVSELGYNPLYASIDIYLNAGYVNPDSIAWIEKKLSENEWVNEVYYQKDLMALVNDNVKKISGILFGFSLLLLVIAIVLINNSIRLSIFAKRFIIRTMQLVGATPSFISRPFVLMAFLQGLLAGLISVIGLFILLYYGKKELPEMIFQDDLTTILTLSLGLVTLGIAITACTTFIAVRKYIYINPDKLF